MKKPQTLQAGICRLVGPQRAAKLRHHAFAMPVTADGKQSNLNPVEVVLSDLSKRRHCLVSIPKLLQHKVHISYVTRSGDCLLGQWTLQDDPNMIGFFRKANGKCRLRERCLEAASGHRPSWPSLQELYDCRLRNKRLRVRSHSRLPGTSRCTTSTGAVVVGVAVVAVVAL